MPAHIYIKTVICSIEAHPGQCDSTYSKWHEIRFAEGAGGDSIIVGAAGWHLPES